MRSDHFQRAFKDSIWGKLAMMLAITFFLYLGDAIVSDWVPTYMQTTLGGSLMMGIMMSFSSLLGFLADLVFPQIFRRVTERRMVMLAISSVLMTAGILLWTTHFPMVALFLIAMGIWGLYYEFLYFGMSQFVARIAPVTQRSGVWSVIGVIKSVAYFIGPLIGSWLFVWQGNLVIIFVYAALAFVSYTVWLMVKFKKSENKPEDDKEVEGFSLRDEIEHWRVLFRHVWPILLVSYLLGLVDATFWTTGVVFSDVLVKKSWEGGLFVSAYIMPAIFIGFVVARLGIYKGKKKLAEIFLLLSGLFMAGLGLVSVTMELVILALLIGIVSSFAWPMVNAVYSDILARMGREQKHMTGMASSMVNLSYITGPVIAGFAANRIGEQKTMMWMGVFVSLVAVILLIVTPRKLKLPQTEMAEWKD
jgi:MFS family permease